MNDQATAKHLGDLREERAEDYRRIELSRPFIFAVIPRFEGHVDILESTHLGQNLQDFASGPLLDDGNTLPGNCEWAGAWVRPTPFVGSKNHSTNQVPKE